MKKGFSLIEMMIAIAVIFVGFSAVVSMMLSSMSVSNSSKASLKATSLASGILEEYRSVRDESGIAALAMYPTPKLTVTSIDGMSFYPKVKLYNIDQKTVLVEANVSWASKSGPTPFVRNYVLLTNYDNPAVTVPSPYATPTWMYSIATPILSPTSQGPTLTPTPTGLYCWGKNGHCDSNCKIGGYTLLNCNASCVNGSGCSVNGTGSCYTSGGVNTYAVCYYDSMGCSGCSDQGQGAEYAQCEMVGTACTWYTLIPTPTISLHCWGNNGVCDPECTIGGLAQNCSGYCSTGTCSGDGSRVCYKSAGIQNYAQCYYDSEGICSGCSDQGYGASYGSCEMVFEGIACLWYP
jgi:prepilin-type N-terminal cleavage/methylation domain-containing protein